jgi:hypothetical protein
MIVACSVQGEKRGVYKGLVWRCEGKGSFGKPRSRWEDNIKMDLHELLSGCINWIDLFQNRDRWWTLVNAVMNLRVP